MPLPFNPSTYASVTHLVISRSIETVPSTKDVYILHMALQFLEPYSTGESPLKCVFIKCGQKGFILKDGIDGHVDSIRLLLINRNYVDRNSDEHFMIRLLTTSM